MATSSVSTSLGTSLFQQVNKAIYRDGRQTMAAISAQDDRYTKISNFGNETMLGTSRFSQDSGKINQLGERNTSRIASIGSDYYRVPSFGTETKIGSSLFAQDSGKINQLGERNTSRIVDGIKAYTDVSKLGHGRFHKTNENVSLSTLQEA